MIAPASQPDRQRQRGPWMPSLLGAFTVVNLLAVVALVTLQWWGWGLTFEERNAWHQQCELRHRQGYQRGYDDCQAGRPRALRAPSLSNEEESP